MSDNLHIYGHAQGFSLTELLVSLAIISVLAAVTIPYAEMGYIRSKEVTLQQDLRNIRTVLDRFNYDCKEGVLELPQDGISKDCYPQDWNVLIEGVRESNATGGLRYYLRRIPADPFAEVGQASEDHWDVRGYRDAYDGAWSGDDMFDVRVKHDRIAIDGSEYNTW